jgi:hypothetical protein
MMAQFSASWFTVDSQLVFYSALKHLHFLYSVLATTVDTYGEQQRFTTIATMVVSNQ